MKKIALYIGIAIAAISCAKDNIVDPTMSGGAIEISATVESNETRLSTTSDCAWSVGDKIGIFTDNSGDAKNMLFTIVADDANADPAVASTGKMEGTALYATTTRTYYAYYPYSSDYNTTYTIAVDCTQSYDTPLLWATATDGATITTAVELTFKHMRPKVTFNLTAGGKYVTSLTGATATLTGANATATFNIEMGEFTTPATSDIADIPLTIGTDGKITAYLPPMANSNVVLWIYVGDDKFRYIITDSWVSGSSYEYNLTVGRTN